MNLSTNLKQNVSTLKTALNADDIIYYSFICEKEYCVVYVDSLTQKEQIGELLIRPILTFKPKNLDEIYKKVEVANVKKLNDINEGVNNLLAGHALLFCNGESCFLSCDFLYYQTRAITEPPTATVVRGPREGFTESLKVNLSLIRRRINSADFAVENNKVGKYSQTTVCICYISSIANQKVVNAIKNKIKEINIDGVADSSYISKFISERKTSLFKQAGTTEKPDIFVQKLLEGRIGIIVDGSPIALTLPYLLIEDLQSSEDYFTNNYRANMQRIIRIISLVIAIFLPAIFLSAQLFHLQIIPLNFLLTIVNSIKGIPLSPSFEIFFTLLIFEILNEASVRMPKYVGMVLSIVGALVLGDTAVKAGIVSTPTIMIMALSGIGLYTAPELVDSMSVIRLVFLIMAGSIGGYGIILLSCFLIIYLCSLESYGTPILAPYGPLVKKDLKDGLTLDYLSNMKKRPESLKVKNKTRIKLKEKKNEKAN